MFSPARSGFGSALSLLAFIVAIAVPLAGRPHAKTLTMGMLSYLGVITTLREGQVNALLPLSLTLSMLAFSRGRRALGGALMGLLRLKPQYALLFPVVFLVKRRWRELAGMGTMGLGIAGLSLIMLGPGGMVSYMELLRSVDRFPPSPPTWEQFMVNWRAVIMGVAPGVQETVGSALMLAAGIMTALISLLAWRGDWDPASPSFPIRVLATTLATVIATPHSHFYGTVLMLAPIAAMMRSPVTAILPPWIWRYLGLGYLLPLLIYTYYWPAPPWWSVPYYFLTMLLLTMCIRYSDVANLRTKMVTAPTFDGKIGGQSIAAALRPPNAVLSSPSERYEHDRLKTE